MLRRSVEPVPSALGRWLVSLAGLALGAPLAGAAELAPGVVVDPERGAVYMMGAGGGLERLDSATGQLSWSTSEALRPLAVHAGRVLAQAPSRAGGLRLVILDANGGGRVLREATLDLPRGVEALVDDRPDVRFRLAVEQAGARVELRWTWQRRPLRGAVPESLDGGPPVQRLAGGARADLMAGIIEGSEAETPEPGLPALPAALAAQADAGAFRERPRPMGSLLVATQVVAGEAGPALVLRRWTSQGLPLPEVPLPPDVTLQLASADGRHVLVSRREPGAAPGRAHEWTVLSLETGEPAAQLRAPVAAASFALVGLRVLFLQQPWSHREARGFVEEPLQVRGVDAGSGAPAWSRPLRDTAYRGPWVP